MRPIITLLPALTAALLLSGCISFAAAPPPSLLTLTPDSPLATGQTSNSATAATILIQLPSVPASLASARVPVQTTPTEIAYVKEAIWSEPPARLFARLLADTIGSQTGRVVLTPAQSMLDPGARLGGELRSFGLDAATGDAVVTYDATLIRGGSTSFEKRRFEAREPVGSVTPQTTGLAINRAANRVAAEVATWVGK
ncbi:MULTISPECIES: ABC-type transport auxiliary lipoprotein family protein [unclassified Sphingomonas]|uniref:ABC-type transport auxiliary lipoprotein family protein n=1 Tax=unclassified Sphingomonas TaxID=196159 RepID=UPI000BCA160D|nr:MAG: ABC transporter [Sphingomonas sp. 32-62-10]OYY65164.1 MAG: ABC transporter [Sphingomonas sp. 28-62-11]